MSNAKAGLDRIWLKYIAVLCMLIDHLAICFFQPQNIAYQTIRFIGRITAPIMLYFLAEGSIYSKNIKKYLTRLGVFAILSWPAYVYFSTGKILFFNKMPTSNVLNFGFIYILFLAMLAIQIYNSKVIPVAAKISFIACILMLSIFGDHTVFGILYALNFAVFREKPVIKWLLYCEVSVLYILFSMSAGMQPFIFGLFIVPLLICAYNGKRGSEHPFHKWFFYLFYPLHLMILGFIRWQVV